MTVKLIEQAKPVRLLGLYSPSPRMGKGTFAEALQSHVPSSSIMSFADPMRAMAEYVAGKELGDKDKDIIPHLGCTYRHVLNTLGTEWGRKCIHEDIWVNHAQQRYRRAVGRGDTPVIFDDMRFGNEMDMVLDEGGVTVKIVRPSTEPVDRHEAQGRLENREFDYVIANDGDIEDLKFKALALCWKLGLA